MPDAHEKGFNTGYATARPLQPDGYTFETRRTHSGSATQRGTRAALIAHVGGKPSVEQQTLIERACQLQIRIAMMDRDFADGHVQTEHDSRTYLAWSNSLTRTLRALGLEPASARPLTPAEALRRTYVEERP